MNTYLSLPESVKKNPKTISVNGENLSAYVIGDNTQQSITIKGMVPDLLNAFDVGFYASVLDGRKAAMTVTKINAWIHEGNGSDKIQIADYPPLVDAIRTELSDDKMVFSWDFGFLGKGSRDVTETAIGIVTDMLSGGVEREGMFGLTKFIHPSTITFRGILENGMKSIGNNSNTIILDEEPIHKKIDANTIDSQLFANRFPGATFKGLKDMISGKTSPEASQTGEVLYSTISSQFSKDANGNDRVVPVQFGLNLGIVNFQVDAEVRFKGILDGLFDSPSKMSEFLRKLEVEVEISTFPYSDDVADYGVKDAPLTPNKPYNPVILWGLSTNQDFSLEN